MNRGAAAVALLAAVGCGNWSNEDIVFVEALPTNQALRVALPAHQAQPLCAAPGESQVWLGAKQTGDGLNAGVDFMVGLVDTVRSISPTTRRADAREWGPFDDGKHPGKEIRITMTRRRDVEGVPTYAYAFEARPRGGAFQSVLDGSFTGPSAKAGQGTFTLRFPVLRALGMNDKPTDPTGDVAATYDRSGDPRTVTLGLARDGFGLSAFDYAYAGYQAGQGSFFFQLVDAQSNKLIIDTQFTPEGAGHAKVTVIGPRGGSVDYQQCWDAASCITFVDDPFNISRLCNAAPCLINGPCPDP